jgi:molybdenum cofactor cytidylyltransferase
MTTAAVVLAAGAGSRFGGGKLRAELHGRAIVAHVVDAARAAGLEPIVIVVQSTGELDDLELGEVRRVVNPNPAEGLSTSVRLGVRALELDDDVEAVVILPGDQPFVRPEVIRSLMAASVERPGTPFVVARYANDGAPNPILARRSIWRLADELAGDRGFGPVLAAHPELVRVVAVDGANPDVDTAADLAAIGSARPGSGGRINRRRPGDVS